MPQIVPFDGSTTSETQNGAATQEGDDPELLTDSDLVCITDERAPRVGLEEPVTSSGNMTISETGGAESGAVGAQSGAADARLVELAAAWPALSDSVKSEILKLVRGGISVSRTS